MHNETQQESPETVHYKTLRLQVAETEAACVIKDTLHLEGIPPKYVCTWMLSPNIKVSDLTQSSLMKSTTETNSLVERPEVTNPKFPAWVSAACMMSVTPRTRTDGKVLYLKLT